MLATTTNELVETLDAIQAAKPRVLVWGDSCQDVYHICRRERDRLICTEVRECDGMAGGVEAAVHSIGCRTPKEGPLLHCTEHVRTVVDDEVVQWVEFPDDHRPAGVHFVLDHLAFFRPHALLVSDYGRGACTPDGLRKVIDAANAAGVPVLVDPHRQTDWSRYAGASVIKTSCEFYDPAQRLARTTTIVTRGANGMTVSGAPGWDEGFFASTPRECVDATGAGDVVLAALGCAVAAGIDLARACRLANAVAGVKCRRLGPLAMGPGELRTALEG